MTFNGGVRPMERKKKWNTYIMAGNLKVYLRKAMSTTEAVKWLQNNCKADNGNHFMCGMQVFCECK
jgi:hypothetical protein